MGETYITLETAKLAKSIGFDEYSICSYQDGEHTLSHTYKLPKNIKEELYAPTQSHLQKWLREKKLIHIALNKDDLNWSYQLYDLLNSDDENNALTSSWAGHKTYEEALEEGLKKALNIIISNKDPKFLL